MNATTLASEERSLVSEHPTLSREEWLPLRRGVTEEGEGAYAAPGQSKRGTPRAALG